MSNRWQMNRIGFVNFWLYDEEIFQFNHGKLLLRGANASGKSITTQSFIPFILDGDRTPSRLDPFGSSDRKMEYYFLGNGEREDVTGYLFLEFKKENTDQYRTIGIGQRAQKGKPMEFWGFLILDGTRIGYDRSLYKSVGSKRIPYTRQELKKELGEANLFAEKQSEYMGLVNKHIFGFPRIEQYDQFIRLMIKVRAPKLSRDFKPTKVYEILNESLQTLSDEDLRAMVDAMEKMDDIQNRLDSLNAAYKDCRTIQNEYTNYNKYMLSKKAEAFLEAQKQGEDGKGRLKKLETEIAQSHEEGQKREQEDDRLERKLELLGKEKELLSDKDLDEQLEKLEARQREKDKLIAETAEWNHRIETNEDNIRGYLSELRESENHVQTCQNEIDRIVDQLDQTNEILKYENHQAVTDILRHGGDSIFVKSNAELKILSLQLTKGLKSLQRLNEVEAYWNKEEEALSLLNIKRTECEEETRTAESMDAELRDELAEAFHILTGRWKELSLEKTELNSIVSCISTYEGPRHLQPIQAILDQVKRSRDNILLQSKADKTHQMGVLRQEYMESLKELELLKNTSELIPQRRQQVSRAREVLQQKGILCEPLYRTLEFSADTSPEQQALIESQLLDMGMLDALVVAREDYDRARKALNGLSDSLVSIKDGVHTGYNKLTVGNVDEQLRVVTAALIDTICEVQDEASDLVLSSDGYYRNGALEGHSCAEQPAIYVGLEARQERLRQQIEEKESECGERQSALESAQKLLEDIQESIKTLAVEYREIPNFADLDHAIDLAKEAGFNLDRALADCQQKETEIAKLLVQKKECNQEVIATCRALPYERTIITYGEACEAVEEYKDCLRQLETGVTRLASWSSRCSHIRELMEKEEEARDDHFLHVQKAEHEMRRCTIEINGIEEFLDKPENKQMAARLAEVKGQMMAANEQIRNNREHIAAMKATIQIKSEEVERIQETLQDVVRKEQVTRTYFEEEWNLKLIFAEQGKSVIDCAKSAAGVIRDNDKHKSVGDVVSSLNRVYQQHSSHLIGYGTSLEDCFEEDVTGLGLLRRRQRVVSVWEGRTLQFEEFQLLLKESIESTELLIQEKDRALFEDILADTLSRKLSNRIAESRNWIVSMSKLMREMDTSMGLTFSLDWKPKDAEGEQEINTQELEKLLSRDRKLLTAQDIEKVSAHFRSKIKMAKQIIEDNGETANYGDLIRETLDYRRWFEFKLYFYRNGESKKELTNSAFNRFSGGEKAMAMYVPLFAAVNAQYKKSDSSDYPRIIALDEAFAGVDDKNISSMFELVQKLDFDYIMNSQALWGCYETVRDIMIAELHRPANSDVVTVIYYSWNGRERVLYEG